LQEFKESEKGRLEDDLAKLSSNEILQNAEYEGVIQKI
jgi:hypothetical protein